ncbi:MAG: hypothetical protein AABX82_08575 [Nanoarchaeota archaeon]
MQDQPLSSYTFSPKVGDYYRTSGAGTPFSEGIVQLAGIESRSTGVTYARLQQDGELLLLPIDYLLRNDGDAPLFCRIGPDKKEPQSLSDIVVPGDRVKTRLEIGDRADDLWMTYVGQDPSSLAEVPSFSFALRHPNGKDYHVLASHPPQFAQGVLLYSSPDLRVVAFGSEEHARIMRLRGDYHATRVIYEDSFDVVGGMHGDGSVNFTSKALYIPSERILVQRDTLDHAIAASVDKRYKVLIGAAAEKAFEQIIPKDVGSDALSLESRKIQPILVSEAIVAWANAVYLPRNPSFEMARLLE